MSKANPRTDESSAGSTPDPEAQQEAVGEEAGGETAPGPEEELHQSIEERYEELERRYDEIRDQLDEYNRTAMEFIQDHPGICIAGALGFGYVVGRLASRRWLK